jgi:hypothetical protein
MLTPELKKEIKKLVERANHGDQNAMAMIEQVRKNASGGVALAQESHQAIMQCVMGEESSKVQVSPPAKQALKELRNPALPPERVLQILCFLPRIADGAVLHAACVILSKGPFWPTEKTLAVQSMVPPPAQGAFVQGTSSDIAQVHGEFGFAGHCIGHACRIQAVRNAGLPASKLNASMGWELDC